MVLFYCDQHEFPLPEGHRFPVRKYRLLRELLALDSRFLFEAAPLAKSEIIALVHDPAYVRAFLDGALDPLLMRRIGFPWSEGLVRRTLASLGGTLAASEQALADGAAGTLAGGTHHAFRGEGSGFCVFNDIAVAIVSLRERGRVTRAAVVDLDVHQGDGTAEIFEGDEAVLTCSVHGRNNFPFRKKRSRIDIDLPDGTGDDEYLGVLDSLLPRVVDFRPGIVLYQSGVDALAADRLGRLSLTHAGLRERDRRVLEACRRGRLPVVVTLGGGYAEPIEDTVEAHANTFRTAADVLAGCGKLEKS